MSNHAAPGKLARVARTAAKVVAAVVAVAVIAVIAVVVFVRTDRGLELLRRAAVAQVRKTVPGLRVGRLEGGVLRDLALRNVDILDDQGDAAVHVDLVTVHYRLWPLLRREVAVSDVQVQGLRVLARPDPRGGLNLAHLTRPASAAPSEPGAGKGKPWSITVARVQIDGASSQVETPDGLKVAVPHLHVLGGARLTGGDLAAWVSARVQARAGGASAGLDGNARLAKPAAGPVQVDGYDVALTVADLDPASLRAGSPAGRVSLALHASGAGVPPAADARADAELRLSPSELAGVKILGGRVTASLRGERWEIERSTLRAAGASATLAGRGQGRRFVADVDARLNRDLARGHGPKNLRGRGTLAVHAEGTAGGALAVRAHGRVDGLVANDTRIGRARLSMNARGTPAAPAATVRLIADEVLIARGAPAIDRLNLAFDVGAAGLHVQASARGPHLHAAVDARGAATAEAGDVTIDQLALDFATKAYRQRVALERPARLRYRSRDGGMDASLAGAVVRGEGARFTGRATLDGEYHPGAVGRGELARADVRLMHASTAGTPPLDAELHAFLTRTQGTVHLGAWLPGARANLQLDAAVPLEVPRRGPPRLASRGPLDVRVKTSRIQLQSISPLQRAVARQGITGGTMSLDVSATGDVAHPEIHATFDVRDVMYRNIAGLGRDSRVKTVPGLGGTLKVDAKDGDVVADLGLLIRGAGILKAHAVMDVDVGRVIRGARPSDVPLRATVEIPKVRLASLADFTDGLAGVDGQLHGRVDLTGTVKRPSGRAELAIDEARVDDVRFQDVRLTAEAREGMVRGRLNVAQAGGGRIDGSLTLDRGDGDRVEAYLTGKDLDVAFGRVFLPTVREMGGRAQLSVTAKGAAAAPRVWASLSVEGGRIGVIGQPTFRDVRVAAALEPGRLDLNDLQMTSGDGKLQGRGWVTLGGPHGLTPQTAVFTAHARRFLVAAAGSSSARIDGDLVFDAALREDVLAGKVNIPDANVWLYKTPSPGVGRNLQKVGPHDDVRFVDAAAQAAAARALRTQRQAAATAVRLALKATASPVYVRGKDLDLEIRSNVQIGTVPDGPRRGALTLGGAIHIPRGRIDIQGQRFTVDHGDVRFDGSPDINPSLDIRLTRQLPEALVIVELRGTPRKPELRLSSDPPTYDQSQIVSLILTGQAGSRPSGGKAFDATSAVATAVLGHLADQIAPELGMDVMRVERREIVTPEGQATGGTDTRVEVGRYVSERIYLSYAHVFGALATANQNEARVEYRMTRRWMLETVFGDAGQGGVDALWTYRF